jgi:hypothetical protein
MEAPAHLAISSPRKACQGPCCYRQSDHTVHTIVGYEGVFLGIVLTLIFTPVYARVRSALLGPGDGAFAPARLVEVFGRPFMITWFCGEGGKGEEGDDGKDGEFHLRWQRCE